MACNAEGVTRTGKNDIIVSSVIYLLLSEQFFMVLISTQTKNSNRVNVRPYLILAIRNIHPWIYKNSLFSLKMYFKSILILYIINMNHNL